MIARPFASYTPLDSITRVIINHIEEIISPQFCLVDNGSSFLGDYGQMLDLLAYHSTYKSPQLFSVYLNATVAIICMNEPRLCTRIIQLELCKPGSIEKLDETILSRLQKWDSYSKIYTSHWGHSNPGWHVDDTDIRWGHY